MLFNLFVWLQIFNQFNARKIKDGEYNVFSGLMDNCWFVAITLVTIIVQISVVMWFGKPLRTTPLSWEQQLFTIGLAFGIVPWNILCTAILKKEWFSWASACVPNEEATDEESAESGVIALSGRASARVSQSAMRNAMASKLKIKVEEAKKSSGKGINPSLN